MWFRSVFPARAALAAVLMLSVLATVLLHDRPPRAAADAFGVPHLEIDADPTNGARPCSPVDRWRTGAPTSGTYTVAVCLVESAGPPEAFTARVVWAGGVASAVDVPDTGDALDDNPDFNDAPPPEGFGTNWSCNTFGVYYPVAEDPITAGVTDALINCNSKDLAAGLLSAEPGLLATITMQAGGTGTETFSFSPYDGLWSAVNSPEEVTRACGAPVVCLGATVEQRPYSAGDYDADGILNASDNCPSVYNPEQRNSDSEIDNGPGIATVDVTVPTAANDGEGDACETDGDTDNDGLIDMHDANPPGFWSVCSNFRSSSDGHASPSGGDLTNDDNGNGNPAQPMGTDAADNGPSWDTDSDGALDAAECRLGFDPRDRTSKPSATQCANYTSFPFPGIGPNTAATDADNDGLKDCVEANDTNGDGAQNYPGDKVNSAKAANGLIGKTLDFDLNGDGAVNYPGDTILSAKLANHTNGVCM